MAINFAAANMAGYNNPPIEVFKTVLSANSSSLTQYPDKSIILNCLSRGSIPVIILNVPDGTLGFLLILGQWSTTENGASLIFYTPAGTSGSTKIQITYPENDEDPPVVVTD